MATLDRIMQMKTQGINDEQITMQLQNEGVSPKEINDSLNQARVKYAITNGGIPQAQAPQTSPTPPAPAPLPDPSQSMTQSPQPPQVQTYPPQQQQYQEGYTQDNYYSESPQAYSDSDFYYSSGIQDTQTMSEIAEQVTMEKTEAINSKINDLITASNFSQDKIADIDMRLKRIEDSIDKLQQSVIGKVGEFGNSSAQIHQDLENLHGTVANLMNPLIDNVNEMKKFNEKR